MDKMKERANLLKMIDEVSFAIVDCNLYLDTHPCDQEAMEYMNKYTCLRMQAVEEYTKKYGPLVVGHSMSECYWNWIDSPWPWKGEC